MRKIRMVCIEKTQSKLSFVKLVKEVARIGLKEAKDLCDILDSPHQIIEFDVPKDTNIDQFRKDMVNVGGRYLINGGVEFDREFKLLTIGVGLKEDYVEFISQNLNYFDNSEEILRFTLTRLSKEDLMEVTKKLTYEQKYDS